MTTQDQSKWFVLDSIHEPQLRYREARTVLMARCILDSIALGVRKIPWWPVRRIVLWGSHKMFAVLQRAFPDQSTPHESGLAAGDVLWQNVVYAADDPTFAFHDPADYPRLGTKVVEMANRPYRKAHRVLSRTASHADFTYLSNLFDGAHVARQRMRIHCNRPWEAGGILVAGAGGFVVDRLPNRSGDANVDWLGEMVVDLVALRRAGDFETADALKREITLGAGAYLFIGRDGIEFVDARDWTAAERRMDELQLSMARRRIVTAIQWQAMHVATSPAGPPQNTC